MKELIRGVIKTYVDFCNNFKTCVVVNGQVSDWFNIRGVIKNYVDFCNSFNI